MDLLECFQLGQRVSGILIAIREVSTTYHAIRIHMALIRTPVMALLQLPSERTRKAQMSLLLSIFFAVQSHIRMLHELHTPEPSETGMFRSQQFVVFAEQVHTHRVFLFIIFDIVRE